MSCKEVFRMFEGYYGPYFTPSVDADGNLTWTNNADLPNPPAINIKGVPGTGLEISGLVATEADLPATAEDWTCYLVGTEVPYTVYTFNPNSGWISLGQLASGPKGDPGTVYTPSVSPEGLLSWTNDGGLPNPEPVNIKGPKGDTGEGVPADGTPGQVLTKTEDGAAWEDPQGGGGSGLTEDVKQALLQIAQKVAYIDAHGDDYYQDLYDALYPPADLVSISATFNQGSTVVYDTDSLDSLRPMLTVIGTYEDQSTAVVTNYALGGTLTAGTSTITVSYAGKTTTFTVNVTHEASVFSVTNNLTGATNSNSATSVTEGNSYSGTITADAGYTLTGATVSITMGGTDITSTAYNNGVISVASVTGALVITVSAAVVALSSISAVYTQSGTVYDTDSLNSLKDDLVVTATYSDSTTAVIPATDYTLSGTLAVGTSTITVSYGGETTTFTVTVTESSGAMLYDWDFTQSLTDSVSGQTAVLRGKVERTASGLNFNSALSSDYTGAAAYLGEINLTGKTIEVDVVSMNFAGSNTNHSRMVVNALTAPDGDSGNTGGYGALVYRSGQGWSSYGPNNASGGGRTWSALWNADINQGRDYFSGKTIKIVYDSDGHTRSLYADDLLLGTQTNIYFNAPYSDHLYIGGGSTSLAVHGDQIFEAVISGVRIYSNGEA